NFDKSDDVVEKTDDPTQVIPEGYVKVTFKTEDENKGKLDGKKLEKIYYVNPKAEIKLVELADGQTANEKQLAVPKTLPADNYEFVKWYEEIDTENSITSERIHVAKFRLVKVTLTYEAGEGATGNVPAELEVDYGTSVRLAGPGNLAKPNATFAGWKIGEKTYQAGKEVTLTKNTTATAEWNTAKHTVTFDTKGGSNVP
ncbi:InlB B-repeat-containing protein, partial [Citroniella saccharovorans]